jgi:hypothetical protein
VSRAEQRIRARRGQHQMPGARNGAHIGLKRELGKLWIKSGVAPARGIKELGIAKMARLGPDLFQIQRLAPVDRPKDHIGRIALLREGLRAPRNRGAELYVIRIKARQPFGPGFLMGVIGGGQNPGILVLIPCQHANLMPSFGKGRGQIAELAGEIAVNKYNAHGQVMRHLRSRVQVRYRAQGRFAAKRFLSTPERPGYRGRAGKTAPCREGNFGPDFSKDSLTWKGAESFRHLRKSVNLCF